MDVSFHQRICTIDPSLSVEELAVTLSHFLSEISLLQAKKPLPGGSSLLPLLASFMLEGEKLSNAKLA